MRKILFLAALAVPLAACGGNRGIADRERPDEFAVARNQPLVVPPDFALVPPAPGTARESDASQQALEALFGGPAARSAGETGVLNQAGARAQPGIRSEVADPETPVVDKGAVTRDIVAAPEGDGQDARAGTPQ